MACNFCGTFACRCDADDRKPIRPERTRLDWLEEQNKELQQKLAAAEALLNKIADRFPTCCTHEHLVCAGCNAKRYFDGV